jgi:putative ABC transport system permease protein
MHLLRDFRLALRSLRNGPYISVLIVAVIAVGISSSVIAITLYHAKAGNPIWWKDDVLFRVLLDSRPASHEGDIPRHPEYPPFTLIYRDALAVYQSKIPERSVMQSYAGGLVGSTRPGERPFKREIRVTTHEFFAMFDVPFVYGHAWQKLDDEAPSQVAVISRYLNDRLFGGANSVGRNFTLNGQPFTVIGVLDRWIPLPRFYDEAKDFGPPDDVFVPLRWAETLPDVSFQGWCQKTQTLITGFREIEGSDCLSSIGVWVELKSSRQYREFNEFLDNYSRVQQQAGRFERPLNNRLVKVSTWLEMNDVVGNESRIQVVLSLIFLGICILNALGLTLAKFMGAAPIAGLRRALGATRVDIVRQHLMEVLLLGALAWGIGVGVAWVGLRLIRIFVFPALSPSAGNPDYATIAQSLSHMDGQMILLAFALSLLSGVLAGLYPAWRVGRMAPATFLKVL